MKKDKIVEIMLNFIIEIPFTTCSILTRVSAPTSIDWYHFCREIFVSHHEMDPLMLGGPGIEVQIDESMMFKRKFNVGTPAYEMFIFIIFIRSAS